MANKNYKNPQKAFRESLIALKKYGYVAGILLVLLGVCLFLKPVATTSMFVWFMLGGFLVTGISKIVLYFRLPQEFRNGLDLALGILWVLCAVFLLTDLAGMPIETTLSIEAVLGVFIGFNCIFTGIVSICGSGTISQLGGSAALCVISGILEIICGCLVLSAPLMGLFAMTFVFGIYLTVMGVSLIIRCLAY